MEFATGAVEGQLLVIVCAVGEQGAAVGGEDGAQELGHRLSAEGGVIVQVGDELAAEEPEVVAMLAQGLA